MAITKQQAAEAFGYGYRIEYLGFIQKISGVFDTYMTTIYEYPNKTLWGDKIDIERFGESAFILCNSFSDLTKEIDGKIPIVELAKKFPPNTKYEITHYDNVRNFDDEMFQVNCCVENDSSRYIYFTIHKDITKNSYALNQELKSMHFSFFDDSVVKWME